MKIIIYCQHVLGIGHLVRTLEISRALKRHQVILVTGGDDAGLSLPDHVRQVRFSGLMMDSGFHGLFAADAGKPLDRVKKERQDALWRLFQREAPDIFLVELYPFGRKAFRFELEPVLKGIRSGELPRCRVICSLRDILVEKEDAAAYEARVLKQLNTYFDALIVHADPELLTLDKTFTRMSDIAVPIFYSGFVSSFPAAGAGKSVRAHLGLGHDARLLVSSAGGGKVGGMLLQAVVNAHTLLPRTPCLHVFTGPYLDDNAYDRLKQRQNKTLKVCRFTDNFLSFMAAADLSISMAGYNTCMNILATRVPALVWPFPQNREQKIRAEKLAALGWMQVLGDQDLDPVRLAGLIARQLSQPDRPWKSVDLNGAANTAAWLERS
jgi:predicted glycosyltransferase